MRTRLACRLPIVSLVMMAGFADHAAAQFPPTAPGRYVAMVSPTEGETFVSPLNLRLVAIGHDDNIYTNQPCPGHGLNATRVQVFLDDVQIFEQEGRYAEYHVFKGVVRNLNVLPGTHRIWARATYTNASPTIYLDSPPITIVVRDPGPYAQTVNLTQDVVLGGDQSLELVGTEDGRIRLNGNGHRIVAPDGTSGRLTLRHVDAFDLGTPPATPTPPADPCAAGNPPAPPLPPPGIDVTTTGAITIEDSTFDTSNAIAFRLNGSATASIRRNLFRSNMRVPIGQFPFAPSTTPLITLRGTSSGAKTFAGNNVAAGSIQFANVNRWTIGWTVGDERARDSNILIGPRAAFYINDSTDVTVRGNFIHHNYYGGWSQGELLELHGSRPILVEHNVLMDSSWPVRGIADEFRYNLLLEAGHQWLIPGNGANIHHNLFVGGDNDGGGITGYYDFNARIENNTFDGLRGRLMRAAVMWQAGSTTIKSNAFTNVPEGAVGVVDRTGGTIAADYNGFFNPESVNYTRDGAPPHDLRGGASTDPRFAGPLPTVSFDMNEVAVWTRSLSVIQILSSYRARYTPTAGSPFIDAGDPTPFGAGNDIGAIGAGTPNSADRFGTIVERPTARP